MDILFCFNDLISLCQVSAARASVTWSAVVMEESALQTALMATSACARSASGELFVKRVSQLYFPFFPTRLSCSQEDI